MQTKYDDLENDCDSLYRRTIHTIRDLIIPEGVKGFAINFGCNLKVLDNFKLPDTLLSIGIETNAWGEVGTKKLHLFGGCIIPEVIIPKNVKILGDYSFAGSRINKLVIPPSVHSVYGRQFKDAPIDVLYLPASMRNPIGRDYTFRGGEKIKKIIYYDDNTFPSVDS